MCVVRLTFSLSRSDSHNLTAQRKYLDKEIFYQAMHSFKSVLKREIFLFSTR
eukprot:m.250597 g.250597  ORF g.250597 m.250597 type:complete len:52 (-) comp81418_c0_seq1:35-190(-)